MKTVPVEQGDVPQHIGSADSRTMGWLRARLRRVDYAGNNHGNRRYEDRPTG
jgi:hypothetical protein